MGPSSDVEAQPIHLLRDPRATAVVVPQAAWLECKPLTGLVSDASLPLPTTPTS